VIQKRTTQRGTVYEVRLRDPNGREYSKTFLTKKEATTYEATERAARARGTWIDPRSASLTFAEAAAQWLASNPAKRAGTLARDECALRVHLLPALGSRRLSELTPRMVQALVNDLSGRLAPRTVDRTYGVLRAVLTLAVEHDLIGRSPCRSIRLPAKPELNRPALGPSDVARLAEAIGPDLAPMIYLGAVCGLRWGECAGLRAGAVHFTARTLTVSVQRTRGHGGRTVEGPPKSSAGRRTLTLPGPLVDLLAQHYSARGLTVNDDDAYVFAGSRGAPLEYSKWRRARWLPAVASAGLDGVTFHDLRRLNATALVLDNIDLKTAQARLGHSDPRLTLAVYARATTEGDERAATALAARFMAR
jgi:integrase